MVKDGQTDQSNREPDPYAIQTLDVKQRYCCIAKKKGQFLQ